LYLTVFDFIYLFIIYQLTGADLNVRVRAVPSFALTLDRSAKFIALAPGRSVLTGSGSSRIYFRSPINISGGALQPTVASNMTPIDWLDQTGLLAFTVAGGGPLY